MITIRRLLLFSCLALLGGCTTLPCNGPSLGDGTGDSCHVRLILTNINVANNLVQGVIPDDVFIDAGETIPKAKHTFYFFLLDFENLLKKGLIKEGGIYDFSGPDGSSYVGLYPDVKLLPPSKFK